jgi:hypothetical protein
MEKDFASAVTLAGTETVVLADPPEQSTGVEVETPIPLNVHEVAFCTAAETVVVPPRPPKVAVGDADSVSEAGGGALTTTTVLAIAFFTPAVATISNLYFTAVGLRFSGRVMLSLIDPDEHEPLIGNPDPVTAGMTDTVHVVALATAPERVTVPPS